MTFEDAIAYALDEPREQTRVSTQNPSPPEPASPGP
jgi:hypothetical protein